MQETKTPTRAELLDRCKAAGLRATGWKKEKMTQELARLAAPEDTSEDEGAEKPETASAPDEPTKGRRPIGNGPTGWCSRAPMWSRSHLDCHARRPGTKLHCSCACHADGWVRPPVPAGAQLSKFNEEDAR